jgi:hypothetical protein
MQRQALIRGGYRVRVMAPADTEKVYVLRGMSASFPSILLREMLTNALRSALSSSHQQTWHAVASQVVTPVKIMHIGCLDFGFWIFHSHLPHLQRCESSLGDWIRERLAALKVKHV